MVNLVFAGDSIASDYEARIIATGGTLSFTHLAAVRAFIATGKSFGWWDKIIDCCPFLGSNMAAGLVKLVAAPGAGTSVVAYNSVPSLSYSLDRGVVVSGNGGTAPYDYLDTGFIAADHGCTTTNFSYGAGLVFEDDVASQGNGGFVGQVWFGPFDPDWVGGSNFGAQPWSSFGGFGWNRSYNAALSCGPGNVMNGATDGIGNINGVAIAVGPLDVPFHFFNGYKSGVLFPTQEGSVSFYFFGTYMTPEEIRSITAAARQMHVSARQVVVGTHDVFIGDSITAGQGADGGSWAERVMTARRSVEPHYHGTNVGQSGITTLDASFPYRYSGTGAYPVTIYMEKMGQNDISGGTDPSTGIVAPSVVAAYKQALIDMATTLKALNTLTILVSVSYAKRADPWLTMENDMLSQFAFTDACLEAAAETGTLGVDTCRPMWADPDPSRFLVDNLHLNGVGSQFVADLVMAAYATYRGW